MSIPMLLTILSALFFTLAFIETRFFTNRTRIGSYRYEFFCYSLEFGLIFAAFATVGYNVGW